MPPRLRIAWQHGEVIAHLRDTASVKQLLAALPRKGTAQTWGEEVYFALPIDAVPEADARQVVEPGAVCYWVEGSSLALPFGPTPISQGKECRLVTRCNILGQLEGDPRQLAKVKPGDTIRVELISDKAS
ncbi:MAG TPA: cyclophilin-like fold protein [Burkholderiales bacterium]|nr:cyclophilin-like fold protein [Burkholderiales bacterium]